MASFTSVGNSVELEVPAKNENVLISISGTYDMTILFQKKVGDGAWKTITTYDTANATVADYYTTRGQGERLRLFVSVDTSGTAVATLTDESDLVLHKFSGVGIANAVQIKQSGLDFNGNGEQGRGSVTIDADVTLTAKDHAGRILLFDVASGATATLPAATGTGNKYRFFVKTTVTSNSDVIQVANATDEFLGSLFQIDTDTANAVSDYPALDADGYDTITLNGSTTGGLKGDYIEIEDVASGMFAISGTILGTGTVATPFSADVS